MPNEKNEEWTTSTQKNRRDFSLKNFLLCFIPKLWGSRKGNTAKQGGVLGPDPPLTPSNQAKYP